MYRGGVQNQAEKNSKNAFRPVPVQKFTFPDSCSAPRAAIEHFTNFQLIGILPTKSLRPD